MRCFYLFLISLKLENDETFEEKHFSTRLFISIFFLFNIPNGEWKKLSKIIKKKKMMFTLTFFSNFTQKTIILSDNSKIDKN